MLAADSLAQQVRWSRIRGALHVDPTGGKVYFTSTSSSVNWNRFVYQMNLDGTTQELLFEANTNPTVTNAMVDDIALDSTNGQIYWANSNGISSIGRANLNGTNLQELIPDSAPGFNYRELQLDVSGGKMYWTANDGTNSIQRANLDGTSQELLISGIGLALGFDLDITTGKMYWANGANFNPASEGSIQRANFNGSGLETLVADLNITSFTNLPALSLSIVPNAGVNWATAISAGPSNESGQLLTFVVTENSNPSLFSVAPSVSPEGVLTFTPAPNANGTALISLVLTDNGGTANGGQDTSASQTFRITVTSVNDAPDGADHTLTTDEDTQLTITAADFGFTDVDGNSLNRVRISTLPGAGILRLNGVPVSAGEFVTRAKLDASQLTFDPVADASGSPYTTFTFQVEDDGGTLNEGLNLDESVNTITINVVGVNDVPTGVSLQNVITTLPESTSTALAVRVADIVVTDDGLGTNNFYITGPDSGLFEIVGTQLFLKSGTALNFESQTSYDVTVQINDPAFGNTPNLTVTYSLSVSNVNETSTALNLSSTSVAENNPANALIGAFSSVDADAGDSFTYTLVSGTGDTDNNSFTVTGDRLTANSAFDFETQSSYSIRVRTTDTGGMFFEQAFTINVLNLLDGTAGSDAFVLTYSASSVDVTMSVNFGTPISQGTYPLTSAITLFGLQSNDTVRVVGTAGDDVIVVSGASLTINGAELIPGGPAGLTLAAGAGNDTYRFDTDNGLGTITLDEALGGSDTLDFSLTENRAVAINLGSAGAQIVNSNFSLTLSSGTAFENIIGGLAGDSLTGNSNPNGIAGVDGADTLNGFFGDDTLFGGQGDDVYIFGLASGFEADVAIELANQGNDTLNFQSQTTAVTLNLSSTALQQVHTGRSLQVNSTSTFENASGGTAGDSLTGGSSGNVLTGNGGNDTLNGFFGNDTLVGGQGDDVYLFGVASGFEADVAIEQTNQGNDTLNFQSQTTAVTLNLSSTALQQVHAGRSLQVNSTSTFENASGGSAGDSLTGGSGGNVLNGNGGNDTLNGFFGSDTLNGGLGDDTYTFGAVSGSVVENDVVNEFANQGTDTLNFASQTVPVTLNLSSLLQQGVHLFRTLQVNSTSTFENAAGGTVGDTLTGGTGANILTGNGGNDTLNGFTGNDTLRGGLGDDTYVFGVAGLVEEDSVEELLGQGTDTLNFAAISTPITLDLGINAVQSVHLNRALILNRTDSFENAAGGAGADVIRGNALSNNLVGNNGNDILAGLGGNDTLSGGAGDDILVGGRGSDSLTGDQGEDLLISAYVVSAGNEDSAIFLQSLGTTWFGPEAFSTRQAALNSVLVPASTVIDDGDVDTVTSSLDSNLDWLFASLADGVIRDIGDLLSIL